MKIRISISLLPCLALLLISAQANAEKVVGTCKVNVVGAHPFTIDGKFYEGKVPDNTIRSFVSTRTWAHKWAEEYRSKAALIADMKSKMADDLNSALTIMCWSDKGKLHMSPVSNEKAKSQDFPDAPKKYRLVNNGTGDFKPGDMEAMLLSQEFTTGWIAPAEPGELNITQNDGERLVATFSFKSKTYSVTGTVDIKRWSELAN